MTFAVDWALKTDYLCRKCVAHAKFHPFLGETAGWIVATEERNEYNNGIVAEKTRRTERRPQLRVWLWSRGHILRSRTWFTVVGDDRSGP